MIRDYIKNYIIHNTPRSFNDYTLNNGVWTLTDWLSSDNNPLDIGSSLVFIYYFQIIGIIDSINDFSKGLALIENTRFVSRRVDYKNIAKLQPLDGAYLASSDFISVHQKNIRISLPASNIFSEMLSGHIAYYSLTAIK
jgi:hypothetical protein